ncbi:MAG TPA: M48 family metalloprotease [Steroidobacteraceae bacterium]|jgi:predicted Zn-dependent protease|nr:M48 family metalloprotease [Steroidobacteraceae bacterium]
MRRTLAACIGSLLTLSSSMSFAAAAPGPYGPYGDQPAHPAPAQPGAAAGTTLPDPAAAALGNSALSSAVPQTETADTSLFGTLPDLGGPAYAMITRSDEDQIGQMIVAEIRNAHLLLEDPEVDDYLQQLGMRLASQAHDENQSFHYRCMNDDEINSFATFGGNVFMFTGLILQTRSEGELAAVMAHETGHVVQRHMARAVEAESHLSLVSTAAMLAAVLIGVASRGNPGAGEASEGAMAMAQATAFQKSINFTRSEESEADYVGIQLLAAAGFDPAQMANMFETLAQSEGLDGNEIPAILQNHPVTPERLAAARARAAQFPRLARYSESEDYAFIKERVRVLSATPEQRIDQYYANLRVNRPLTAAERYGEALTQIQDGRAAAAVPTLQALQGQYPELIMLYSALGQAYATAGQERAARAQFAQAERLFPRNVPLTVHYAEMLIKNGKPDQAHALLLDLFNNVDPTPPQIQLTAQAASAAGDTGDAYYYMAQYNLANGELGLANQELELALATPQLSNVQRERFRAQLLQVRDWMREQQQARHGG